MGNFLFLKSHWEDLANTGELAEKYVYSDPNGSMYKQGIYAETMVKYACLRWIIRARDG